MSFRFECGHCSTSTVGRVAGSSTKFFDKLNWRPYCLIVCDNCKRASYLSFAINSGWAHLFADFEKNDTVIDFDRLKDAEIHPKRESCVPPFLPGLLSETYGDAEFNYANGKWKSAAQLYLQVLEFACISLKSGGDEEISEFESAARIDLTKRINELADKHIITDSLRKWAHKIRILGQFHKHRYVECDEEDCSMLRRFTDLFIQYTITMPKMIKEQQKD